MFKTRNYYDLAVSYFIETSNVAITQKDALMVISWSTDSGTNYKQDSK